MTPKRKSPHSGSLPGWVIGVGVTGLVFLFVFGFHLRDLNQRLVRLEAEQGLPPVRQMTDRKPEAAVPSVAVATLPSALPKGKGKIAIVLDDWGYNRRRIPYFESMPIPLTIAVLPGLRYSDDVATAAHKNGHEVILHIPMEAQGEVRRENRVIDTGMSPGEIQEHLMSALETVPYAQGVSNHQGSRATSDAAVMQAVLQGIKQRGLYFLDSFVSHQSVAGKIAREQRVRFAKRTVFLDNEKDSEKIRARLIELAQSAARNGSAIGIGHDRGSTLKVLEQVVPDLERAGYTFVTVSDLAKVPSS